MELVIVILLILVAGITWSLPLIIGFMRTPTGATFLGMNHHPPDYYYYLSQFTLGGQRWFWGRDLYTTDFHQDTLVGWINIFLGRLFALFGIPAVGAYHISALVFTIIFFITAYMVIREIFPDNKALFSRIGAFILFLLGNILPSIPVTPDTIVQHSFWQNFTEPWVRFGTVPHQILGQICILMLFLLTQTETFATKIKLKFSLLALMGLLLATINPIQWVFVISVLTIVTGYRIIRHPRKNITHIMLLGLPLLVVCISGLPIAIYLQSVFKTLPYSQLRDWEAAQQIRLSLWGIILSQGPLFLAALMGLPLFIKRKNTLGISFLAYTVLSLLLFLSPLPTKFNISNVRLLSSVVVFTYALIIASLLETIPKRIKIYGLMGILVVAGFLSLPVFSLQLESKLAYNPTNAYIYISRDALAIYQKAKAVSTIEDNFFVTWPYNVSFPGITGRHTYNGHPLLTIHPTTKDTDAWKFMSKQFTESEILSFLKTNNITYLILTPGDFASYTSLPATPVLQNGILGLYKINN